MPSLDFFSWLIWLVTFALEFGVAVFVCYRGMVKRWPSLFAFLAIKSVMDFVLIGITLASFLGDKRIAIYFDIFWGANGLASLAELWMIIQIGCALVSASKKAMRWMWVGAPLVAGVCVFAVSFLPLWPNYGPRLEIMSTVVGIDRVVSVAWLTTFLIVAVFSDLMGIRWRRHPFGIAIGLAIIATTEIGVSWLLESLTLANAKMLSELSGFTYLAALSVWSIAIAKDEPVYSLTPQIKRALLEVFTYRSAIERVHAK